MKVHIASSRPVGERCIAWAEEHLPEGVALATIEECDIVISVFYNQLLPADLIASKKRCLNFHGGILPQYRGSATLNWAILNGDKEAGITLHEIDERIDHGPVIEIRKFPLDADETGTSILEKAEGVLFEMFKDWFARMATLGYKATPQEEHGAHLYTRADFQVARDLTRTARAFHVPPYEQAFYLNSKGEKVFLKWDE